METDLRLWRSVRESWLRIQQAAIEFRDTNRADLARDQLLTADAAIERLEAELARR